MRAVKARFGGKKRPFNMPSRDGPTHLLVGGPQPSQRLQSPQQPGPLVRDEGQEKACATGGTQASRRGPQFLSGQVILLKIDAGKTVHLQVEQSRRYPGGAFVPADRGSQAANDALLPLEDNGLAGLVVARADFARFHGLISVAS